MINKGQKTQIQKLKKHKNTKTRKSKNKTKPSKFKYQNQKEEERKKKEMEKGMVSCGVRCPMYVIYHVLLYFTVCTFVYILYLYLLLSLEWYSLVISITQGNFNVTHDYTTNEISLSTIYCIVSSGTPHETWRWPSDRAETCSL